MISTSSFFENIDTMCDLFNILEEDEANYFLILNTLRVGVSLFSGLEFSKLEAVLSS